MAARKAKNDNLQKHKERLVESNKALVNKAIAHIEELGGGITFSSVSKVTYEIADIQSKETGITLAGITKNPIYRALVEEAQANQNLDGKRKRSPNIRQYSQGELGLIVHALRVENENLKHDNRILKLKLKEMPDVIETVEPIREKIIKKGNALQDVARSMVNRLCELELAYIDANNTLRLHGYNYTIVGEEALKLFYEKELNDIKLKVRENAPDGES